MTWLSRFVDSTLVSPVERDHRQSDHMFKRRRVVAAATLLVGATLLGFSLATRPGDPAFYILTFALAATWTVGAFLSGPLHAGRMRVGSNLKRPVLQPIAIGLVAVAVFTVGALVVAQIPPLHSSVDDVLDHARYGSLPVIALITVVNGLAEELFFRGALYSAIGANNPVLISTAIYALTTVATGNVMLVFAAAVLGLLDGLQRRVSGGVLAPMLTHVTWSLGMLFILPPLMAALG
ncbi:MAG TPA: type II CAAX endopeptidase family protein [Nocardioidaceae bacterium]|nr:type II CAAX endopeptidase family protein [Nocardioidaceae bacterium]